MNIQEAQMNPNKTVTHARVASEIERLAALLADPHPGLMSWNHACEISYKCLRDLFLAESLQSEDSDDTDFTHALTLLLAEEQERIALRIANTLGEQYGWNAEEKDEVCMEVLGMLTGADKELSTP